MANGIGTNAKIEYSYFDYDEIGENTIYLNKLFISASNAETVENEKVFIACYDVTGKMKFIKNFTLTSGECFIDLNRTISKTDTVKVIGTGSSLNPLFEQLIFFGE
ncbi:MAG: hypothetical protein GX800_10050 [Clostridiaceae bacterium]|nr:hypothetical protein [Clostridiaceae bacterium]